MYIQLYMAVTVARPFPKIPQYNASISPFLVCHPETPVHITLFDAIVPALIALIVVRVAPK